MQEPATLFYFFLPPLRWGGLCLFRAKRGGVIKDRIFIGGGGNGVAVGALADQTSTNVLAQTNDNYGDKLIKRIHLNVKVNGMTANEFAHLLLFSQNINDAEVDTALTSRPYAMDLDGQAQKRMFIRLAMLANDIVQPVKSLLVDGRPSPIAGAFAAIEVKLPGRGWRWQEGDIWNYAIFNNSGAALTTGAVVKCELETIGIYLD